MKDKKVLIKKEIILTKAKTSGSEFKEFLQNYNVIQLAVGVVIGNAVKDLVTSVANDLIMPIIGAVTPNGTWKDMVLNVAGIKFSIGNFISSVLDFLIVALVVFIVIKKILRIDVEKK